MCFAHPPAQHQSSCLPARPSILSAPPICQACVCERGELTRSAAPQIAQGQVQLQLLQRRFLQSKMLASQVHIPTMPNPPMHAPIQRVFASVSNRQNLSIPSFVVRRHLIVDVSDKRYPHLRRVIAAQYVAGKVRFHLHVHLCVD